jgi:sugar phosphate isomerase/epimerase
MARPVTLFTGQWADLTLDALAQKVVGWGYDGLELACWGDHFEVDKALSNDKYVAGRWEILKKYDLDCFAISNHLVGQCVADKIIDERHKAILPARLWGDGDPEGVRQRCADEMKNTARAAKLFGVKVVNGFTGSPVWHMLYPFPPTSQDMIDAGYREFDDAERTLAALGNHKAFGFNFDPSHFVHQLFNPVHFIERFPDRIFHMHVKDSKVNLTGYNSILGSHLAFGDPRRSWEFVSPGHGDAKLEAIIRVFNRIGYDGPLSVEWEDIGMDREHGAAEAVTVIRQTEFKPSAAAFDAAFATKK